MCLHLKTNQHFVHWPVFLSNGKTAFSGKKGFPLWTNMYLKKKFSESAVDVVQW